MKLSAASLRATAASYKFHTSHLVLFPLLISLVYWIVAWLDRVDVYWQDERYRLVAVNERREMHLAFDLENGTADWLVGPTIFAIGADLRHIVLKQHPFDRASGIDRKTTNYYVVARTVSSDSRERRALVRGPLTEVEFVIFSKKTALPAFSLTFDDLE